MKENRKPVAGKIAVIVTAILAAVSFILYQVNVTNAGYFQNNTVSAMPLTWAAVAALGVAFALSLLKTKGIGGKLVDVLIGLAQIAAPVILAYCLMSLVSGRASGLGFLYFSDADVLKEIQTAENMASGTLTIVSIAFYAVSMVVGWVSSFITIRR